MKERIGEGHDFQANLASAGRNAASPPTLPNLLPSVGEEADVPSLPALALTSITQEVRQQGVISAASFFPSLSSAGTPDLM